MIDSDNFSHTSSTNSFTKSKSNPIKDSSTSMKLNIGYIRCYLMGMERCIEIDYWLLVHELLKCDYLVLVNFDSTRCLSSSWSFFASESLFLLTTSTNLLYPWLSLSSSICWMSLLQEKLKRALRTKLPEEKTLVCSAFVLKDPAMYFLLSNRHHVSF